MNLKFEHEFQQKIMTQSFVEPFSIESVTDVNRWRSTWMQELKSWHSPYKAIIDCTHLKVADSPEVREALERMIKFFEGLFLKSAVGFSPHPDQVQALPFDVVATFEEAQTKAGVRGMRAPNAAVDFRSMIQLQNHFAQHVVEMSFSEDVVIQSKDQIATLKGKLTNNLMQWHSKWSLLVDCTRVEVTAEMGTEWTALMRYLSGFFMKTCIGYSPKVAAETYPFKVFRARHKAVAGLEAEGMFMGNDAQCKTAKTPNSK